MINLDMETKKEINIVEKMFNLENNIISLDVRVPGYDIQGKAITAVFEPSKIEIPVTIINSEIKIPITSKLVKVGLNYIQLNFRWGNKLEQSGIMSWRIYKSLETKSVEDEELDERDLSTLMQLIAEVQAIQEVEELRAIAEAERVEAEIARVEAEILREERETKIIDTHLTTATFPINGEVGKLYYESEKGGLYFWDNENLIYSQLNSVKEIYGGNSLNE